MVDLEADRWTLVAGVAGFAGCAGFMASRFSFCGTIIAVPGAGAGVRSSALALLKASNPVLTACNCSGVIIFSSTRSWNTISGLMSLRIISANVCFSDSVKSLHRTAKRTPISEAMCFWDHCEERGGSAGEVDAAGREGLLRVAAVGAAGAGIGARNGALNGRGVGRIF